MTWQPKFRQIDTRPIVKNLLTFIAANQSDALIWAANGETVPPVFTKIYPSIKGRVFNVFPHLMLTTRESHTSYGEGDVMDGIVRLTFEGVIKGGDPDLLIETAEIYKAAIESLVSNIPENELLLNVRYFNTMRVGDEIESDLDEAGVGLTDKSAYFQTIKTRFSYVFRGSIYG